MQRRSQWLPQPLWRGCVNGREPEPQEEQAIALPTLVHPEEASELEGAISLGAMVDALTLTLPGFAEPWLSDQGHLPLRMADSPVGIPMGPGWI